MDLQLALMCGTDIPVPECQLIVHQPTIKEIALIGETDFFVGAQTLCLNKAMFVDETVLSSTTNFQIFMTLMSEKQAADKKLAVQQILTLLFPTMKVVFTPRSMLFLQEGNQAITVDEDNFEALQSILSQVFSMRNGPMTQQSFNPGSKKAKEIADKLMRGRARVAAQKAEGQQGGSLFSQYVSTLTVGVGSLSLKDAMDLTVYQLYDLIERFMLYVSWDMDARCRLAGGKPDAPAENWMKNLH